MKITIRYSEIDTPDTIYPITWNGEINNNSWWEGFLKVGPVLLHDIVVED